MGPRIIPVLREHRDDPSVQRRNAIHAILEVLTARQEEGDSQDRLPPLQRGDWIQTTAFAAVGSIAPSQVMIQSKYGKLNVGMSDIRLVRTDTSEDQEWRKSVTVAGQDIAGSNWKNTGMRVERGDTVAVQADGTITYSPRGSQAVITPDGAANYGWYLANKIPVGALVGRIGNSGEPIMLGSRAKVVAKRSGVLYLGWACQANFATRNYTFPGQYRVKLTVTRPAE
jgi:hypothetical protein